MPGYPLDESTSFSEDFSSDEDDNIEEPLDDNEKARRLEEEQRQAREQKRAEETHQRLTSGKLVLSAESSLANEHEHLENALPTVVGMVSHRHLHKKSALQQYFNPDPDAPLSKNSTIISASPLSFTASPFQEHISNQPWSYAFPNPARHNCNNFTNYIMNGNCKGRSFGSRKQFSEDRGAVFMPSGYWVYSAGLFTQHPPLFGSRLSGVPAVGSASRFLRGTLDTMRGTWHTATDQVPNKVWNEIVQLTAEIPEHHAADPIADVEAQRDAHVLQELKIPINELHRKGVLSISKMSKLFFHNAANFEAIASNVLQLYTEMDVGSNAFPFTQGMIDSWYETQVDGDENSTRPAQDMYYFVFRKPVSIGYHSGMILLNKRQLEDNLRLKNSDALNFRTHLVSFGLNVREWANDVTLASTPDGTIRRIFEKRFFRNQSMSAMGRGLYSEAGKWEVFAAGKLTKAQAQRIYDVFATARKHQESGDVETTTMYVSSSAVDFCKNPGAQVVADEIHPEEIDTSPVKRNNETYMKLVDNMAISLLRAGFGQSGVDIFFKLVSFEYLSAEGYQEGLKKDLVAADTPNEFFEVSYNRQNGQYNPKEAAEKLRVGKGERNPLVVAVREVFMKSPLASPERINKFYDILATSVGLNHASQARQVTDNLRQLVESRRTTALHEAARVGARTAAVTLVISGASLGIRDNAGLTPLDYARQEGHTKVISAIDMAIRLPPSKLNVPGYMHNSGDDFPSDVVNSADEEKGTNVAAIIGIVLGILLGAAVALVLTVGIRRYRLRNGDNKVLALPTRDTSDKPSPPRALCKDAFDDLERSGIESSDEDGATFKHMSSEPVVLQVAGRQHTKEFSTSSPSSPAKHPPDTLAQMPSKPSQNEGEYTCPKCGAVQPRRIFCCKCGEPTPKTAPSAQKAPPPGPMSPTENSLNNLVCSLRNAGRMDARHFTDAPAVPAIPKVLALEDSTTHSSSRQAQAFTYGRNRSASQVGLCEFPDGSPKASGDLQAAEQSRVRRPK